MRCRANIFSPLCRTWNCGHFHLLQAVLVPRFIFVAIWPTDMRSRYPSSQVGLGNCIDCRICGRRWFSTFCPFPSPYQSGWVCRRTQQLFVFRGQEKEEERNEQSKIETLIKVFCLIPTHNDPPVNRLTKLLGSESICFIFSSASGNVDFLAEEQNVSKLLVSNFASS